MSLSTFCDIVWMEIHDDCAPMGDQSQYREIVHKLFIEGIEAWKITYKGADGKMKRLGSRDHDGKPQPITAPTDMMAQARELHLRLQAAKAATRAASQVASPPDA